MFERLFPINSKRRQFMKKIFSNFSKKINKDEIAYKKWRKENLPGKKELDIQRNTKFDIMPKISIIVPLFNTPEEFFKDLIDCMENQTYSNWELCLADGSPMPLEFKDKYILGDDRIKYKKIKENKGISGNTNEALTLASGDYIGLLDHDDYLPEYSLFEVVKAINKFPDVEFMYSDEDKFEKVGGEHYGVFFKPDFSPYTLNSANYICHFSVFKKGLMDKLGGFKSEYDGSQDFDIVLRASTLTDKIVHIPNVLYNWRVHKNSTASGGDNVKPYAYEVAKSVIKDHLKRKNISAKVVDGEMLGNYKVEYLPKEDSLISVIIENYDDINKLFEIINSLTYKNIEYIAVSNDKIDDNTLKIASSVKEAIAISNGDYFYIIDKYLFQIEDKNLFNDLLGICQNDDVGIVSSKLYDRNNNVLHNGIILGMQKIGGYVFRSIPKFYDVYMARLKIIHNVSAVTLKYSLIKKEEYIKVNGFDDKFCGMSQNIDFCLKCIHDGKNIVQDSITEVGIEKLDEEESRNEEEILKKWSDDIKCDRYYNKNLSTETLNIMVKDYKV